MESKLMPCGWEPAVYEAKRKTDVDGDHYYYIKKSNEQTGGTPMTNEPTTGEIVRDLRRCFNEKSFGCVDCACRISSVEHFCDYDKIADRLESQAKENEISRHLIEMQSNVITELTARAESAERERDAAIADMIRIIAGNNPCSVCGKNGLIECMMGCAFEWRGLPQEGEGV